MDNIVKENYVITVNIVSGNKLSATVNIPFYYFDEEDIKKFKDDERERNRKNGITQISSDYFDYDEEKDEQHYIEFELWTTHKRMRQFIIDNTKIELAKLALKTKVPNIFSSYFELTYFQREEFMDKIENELTNSKSRDFFALIDMIDPNLNSMFSNKRQKK